MISTGATPTCPRSKKGYVGNIVVIIDLQDPTSTAGGFTLVDPRTMEGRRRGNIQWDNFVEPRCHHPLRVGDRLNVSYWHHGLFVPRHFGHIELNDFRTPPQSGVPHPTHTCLSIPTTLRGRKGRWSLRTRNVAARLRPSAPAFAWVYDVADEKRPTHRYATINVSRPR